ncbi:MAG: aldo/keto reductase [Clostridia bacterium]|nr:aldo/keto reductase [Clostridia bacterium]
MTVINKLGFGFLRLPKIGEEYDWDTLCKMTDLYLEQGGTFFDTCYTYLSGNSEYGIKKCLTERHPRHSYRLSDKLPGYRCTCYADAQRFFDESLARCGVDYFDVYLLHMLNGKNYEIAEKHDQFRFLREKKAEGKAKRIGFSYHDNAALLDRILTDHPEVDVVLLQINYLDWDTAGIESGKCYETCVRHGKNVLVMEPVKGGSLANIPEDAAAHLKRMHGDWTPADWAVRFVQSLEGVEICLSGMSSVQQVADNMRPIEPLTKAEVDHLMLCRPMIASKTAIACTDCRYCVSHCPKHIAIPDVFRMYNEVCRYPGDDWKIGASYLQLTKTGGKASDCIGCRRCERQCPQHLPIAETMKLAAEKLEEK